MILCCLEGLSQEEAARRLGCSVAAVKGRMERGRQRLRQRLEKRGLTLPVVLGGTVLLAGATSPVPVALAQTTLQAPTKGGSPSAAVAALIEEAMRTMFINKLKAIGAAVLLLTVTGTGVGMMSLGPQAERESAPQAVSDEKPLSANEHVDLYGDRLPEGAVMRLGTIRQRAVGIHLAVTEDGKSIIGTRGTHVSIWDAATGELRQKRELPEPWGDCMPTPDGRSLAQWRGREHTLAIWDVQTLKKVRVLGTEAGRSYGPIAFSHDSKRVAAIGSREDNKGGHDHLICAWDLADGKELFRTEHRNKRHGYRLAFSPDGKRLLATFSSSTSDRGLYCWDIAAGRQAWLNERISPESMVVTSDGKILTAPDGRILDLATGRRIEMEKPPPIPLKGPGGVIYFTTLPLAMTSDSRTLLISRPDSVIVWDMIHGKQLRRLEGAGEEVVAMPDGKSIISNNGSLQRWDLQTGKPLWQDTFALGHIGKVTVVAFSADGNRLASFSGDGTVRLWDVATGRPLRVWRACRPKQYSLNDMSLDISPDGRWILSGGWHLPFKLWNASSDKEVRTIALPAYEKLREGDLNVYHLRIRPDGSQAVASFGPMTNPPLFPHKLATWDVKTGQMLTCHNFEQSDPRSSALSPDGHLLLRDGDLVDTATGQKLARLEGPPSYPCAFSRDGALVVGGSWVQRPKNQSDEMMDCPRVWESVTGKMVAHLKSGKWTQMVAFHPNNRLLAIKDQAANDSGIQLYDVVTNKLLTVCRIPNEVMPNEHGFALAPEGRRLATGMPDGTILVWDISLTSSKPQHLQAKEIASLWDDLADTDAAKAWRAVWRLSDAPKDTLAFLHGRVKPQPTASADVMRRLLADLDSDSFEVREAAVKRLKELSFQAEPALREALNAKPSLEQRRRIEELLTAAPTPPTPEELRQLRALIVLERISTPEARRLLEDAAKGPPSARLTRQALTSLACIR